MASEQFTFPPSPCRMEKIKSKQKSRPAPADQPGTPAEQEQVTLGNTSQSIYCFSTRSHSRIESGHEKVF